MAKNIQTKKRFRSNSGPEMNLRNKKSAKTRSESADRAKKIDRKKFQEDKSERK